MLMDTSAGASVLTKYPIENSWDLVGQPVEIDYKEQ